MKRTIVYLPFILSLLGSSFSCKEEIRSSIPDCKVYIETLPHEYNKLKNPNSAVLYVHAPGAPVNFRYGYGGVLIYRDLESKIRSCDLACPVEASYAIRVDVNMPFAVCPKCNSKFDLSYGFAAPVSGPAKESLRIYHNVFERSSPPSIVVTN